MAQLTCKDLTIGYENRVILDGLTFSVEKGDYLAIVGENGSGKSTLMKTILGLLKPLGGELSFGEEVGKYEIGYLPQQSASQRDFPASVWEVVLSGCLSKQKFHPFFTKRDKMLARLNIDKMGLSDLLRSPYRELSGGQQQRVLLARALCATEKILLLDEPVSGLDPAVTAEMYEIIRRLNEEGLTIIMISHDVREAIRDANKILHLGKRVFFGGVKEYLESEQGKPYAAEGEEK